MAKINISCKNGKLEFSLVKNRDKNTSTNLNLTQTNVINTDSMIFTSNYLLKNPEIVSSFVSSLIIQRNISKVYINDSEILAVVILIIQNIPQLVELYILPNEEIEFEVFEKLLCSPHIKYINCYSMKHFMIQKLDSNDKTVDVRKELFFISNFINDNNLKDYSSLYYKKSINIKNEMNDEDINDYEIFLKVNKYLKTINIEYYSLNIIKNIIKYLVKYKKRNINIKIYEDNKTTPLLLETISYLRLIQTKMKDTHNYNFKIIYSKEYKKKNFLAQVNITNLKISSLIIIITVLFGYVIIEYNAYMSEKSISDINEAIDKEIASIPIIDESNIDLPIVDENPEDIEQQIDSKTAYEIAYKKIFDNLKQKNTDTVGWLKVNNTKIDFPVVQTKDNDYYLSHDFNKNKNTFGWAFADYRNNIQNFDQNTIIYAHNSSKKVMFSDLDLALKEDWHSNKTNQVITFNTENNNMEWEIFSSYEIKVTSDYLYTEFATQDEFLKFANMLKNRSVYDFGIEIKENDKILTLSTCLNSGKKRMVVHARLKAE